MNNEPTYEELLAKVKQLENEMDKYNRNGPTIKETLQAASDIVGAIPSGLFIYQFEPPNTFTLVSGNPEADRLSSKMLHKWLGKEFSEIWPMKEAQDLKKSFVTVMETGTTFEIDDFQYKDDRMEGHFRFRAFRMPQHKMGIAFEDITLKKRAEKSLKTSKDTLTMILDGIPADVYVSDLENHKILFMNKHMKESFGEDLEGQVCFKAFRNASAPCGHCTNDQLVDDNGNPTGVIAWEGQNPITKRWYMNYDRVIRWMDGRHVRLQVATDTTQLKEAEKEKKRLETQLVQSQKMEAIGTLAGGVAHDFNNLMMGMLGNVSLILFDMDETHPYYEKLKAIEKQILSGSKLTSQLLHYARKGKYEIKPINVNTLVEESLETFGRTRKEITVRPSLTDHLYAIEADQGQIEQALLNLFVNAADAMPDGGVLHIETNKVTHMDMLDKPYQPKPGNYVSIEITDTGIGMDADTVQRVFEPFFTTKEMGRGTGLGLASVYGIIKGHGGYIDVVSEKGRGTSFTIYLPATDIEIRKQVKDRKPTILLVDDENVVVKIGVKMLERLEFTVISAFSGGEAIQLYRKHQGNIDMVILDIVMPETSGSETYDQLRQLNPDVKVLLSSGYSINGKAEELLNRGCNDFIQKPFTMDQLNKKVRKLLAS